MLLSYYFALTKWTVTKDVPRVVEIGLKVIKIRLKIEWNETSAYICKMKITLKK